MIRNQIQLKLQIIAISSFLFLSSLTANAFAVEISGVNFDENYLDQGIHMTLQGTGLKNFLFLKAFAAGFYSKQGDIEDVLGNFPKRIEVEYFLNIPGERLNQFTIDTMKKNISNAEFDQIKDQIKQMSQYFVDLRPGDRFSLTYIPSQGTKFELNGRLVGIIKGEKFARAIFSTWIGKRPFDSHLKAEVLGLTGAA